MFFSRTPVLVVTDVTFLQLYGQERAEQRRRRLSTALFRQVIPVPVAENAGADVIAVTVRDAFNSPHAVLFPYRYLDGARFFRRENPDVPVLVMGGEHRGDEGEEELVFACADTTLDLYRAGLSAAALADGKKILILDNGLFREEHRETLREALKAHGSIDEPIFLTIYGDYAAYEEIGCVILAGPAERFLERNLDIPVILFSWLDPGLTPRPVTIVFDDSAWALAASAMRFPLVPGETIRVPSSALIMRKRMDVKGNFQKIRSIFNEKNVP